MSRPFKDRYKVWPNILEGYKKTGKSERGARRDVSLKNKRKPKSFSTWLKHPDRYDWPGIDDRRRTKFNLTLARKYITTKADRLAYQRWRKGGYTVPGNTDPLKPNLFGLPPFNGGGGPPPGVPPGAPPPRPPPFGGGGGLPGPAGPPPAYGPPPAQEEGVGGIPVGQGHPFYRPGPSVPFDDIPEEMRRRWTYSEERPPRNSRAFRAWVQFRQAQGAPPPRPAPFVPPFVPPVPGGQKAAKRAPGFAAPQEFYGKQGRNYTDPFRRRAAVPPDIRSTKGVVPPTFGLGVPRGAKEPKAVPLSPGTKSYRDPASPVGHASAADSLASAMRSVFAQVLSPLPKTKGAQGNPFDPLNRDPSRFLFGLTTESDRMSRRWGDLRPGAKMGRLGSVKRRAEDELLGEQPTPKRFRSIPRDELGWIPNQAYYLPPPPEDDVPDLDVVAIAPTPGDRRGRRARRPPKANPKYRRETFGSESAVGGIPVRRDHPLYQRGPSVTLQSIPKDMIERWRNSEERPPVASRAYHAWILFRKQL